MTINTIEQSISEEVQRFPLLGTLEQKKAQQAHVEKMFPHTDFGGVHFVLGEDGEIVLVGTEKKIKTTIRFVFKEKVGGWELYRDFLISQMVYIGDASDSSKM